MFKRKAQFVRWKGITCLWLLIGCFRPWGTIIYSWIFYHRFFLRHSPHKYQFKQIGVVCMFIASKLEETPKKLKEVLSAYTSYENLDLNAVDYEVRTSLFQWELSISTIIGRSYDSNCWRLKELCNRRSTMTLNCTAQYIVWLMLRCSSKVWVRIFILQVFILF